RTLFRHALEGSRSRRLDVEDYGAIGELDDTIRMPNDYTNLVVDAEVDDGLLTVQLGDFADEGAVLHVDDVPEHEHAERPRGHLLLLVGVELGVRHLPLARTGVRQAEGVRLAGLLVEDDGELEAAPFVVELVDVLVHRREYVLGRGEA